MLKPTLYESSMTSLSKDLSRHLKCCNFGQRRKGIQIVGSHELRHAGQASSVKWRYGALVECNILFVLLFVFMFLCLQLVLLICDTASKVLFAKYTCGKVVYMSIMTCSLGLRNNVFTLGPMSILFKVRFEINVKDRIPRPWVFQP